MAGLKVTSALKSNGYHGGICFLCRRRSYGTGHFVSDRGDRIRIVCTCEDHFQSLRKAIVMPQKRWDFSEERSVEDAACIAGQYLDSIGKTDLATLETHEYFRFARIIVEEFGKALDKRINDPNDIPF